jgi:hypothetical protein
MVLILIIGVGVDFYKSRGCDVGHRYISVIYGYPGNVGRSTGTPATVVRQILHGSELKKSITVCTNITIFSPHLHTPNPSYRHLSYIQSIQIHQRLNRLPYTYYI